MNARVQALSESSPEWGQAFRDLTPPSLQAPEPPTFPTFFELVEQDKVPIKSIRPKGLYEELLGAHPEALYLHALENEPMYQEGVLPLLRELVHRQKKFTDLTLDEQLMLDRATVDFATFTPKKPPLTLPKPKKKAEDDEEPKEAEAPSPPAAGAGYWWLR